MEALPVGSYDTVMVTLSLRKGIPWLALTAVDDYGKPRQELAGVVLNKAIVEYLQEGLGAILRDGLLPPE